MILFLIRHGQTTANLSEIYSGQTDVMLTEDGKEQARALQPLLSKYKFDRVYSSDLTRAAETQRLAIPGIEGARTPLLREIDVGSLAGQSFAWVWKAYGNLKGDFSPFGGEIFVQVTDRLRKFLAQLEANPCERAVAFAHGGLMRSMLSIVLGAGTNVDAVANGNCNVAVFRFDGKRWILVAWNLMGKM
jgi:probable phosphoglycerate mutase